MTDCPETEFPHPEQPLALTDYEDWTSDALDWIEAQRGHFTADDMRAALPPAPHPNLIGAAFNTASNRELIRVVGYRRSTARSRRNSLLRIWQTTTHTVSKENHNV